MREANCPQCRWVSVVDGSGRRRLEMRWMGPAPVAATGTAQASHAA
jgi:hypothetical protein